MDTHELAWAAGFFDGEGCFSSARDGATKRPRTLMAIGQTERSSLDRVQAALGFGKVKGPYRARGRRRPYWQFYINDFEHSQAALAMMWRWLGAPKRIQAAAVFQEVKDYMEKRRLDQEARLAVCPYGHKKDPARPIVVGKRYGLLRQCRECGKRSERRWREAHSGYFTSETRKERRRQLYAAKKAEMTGA